MNREEIVEYLTEELSNVYCDTCNPATITHEWDDEELKEIEVEDSHGACENCHRKMMNWALSKNTAERFADKILESK